MSDVIALVLAIINIVAFISLILTAFIIGSRKGIKIETKNREEVKQEGEQLKIENEERKVKEKIPKVNTFKEATIEYHRSNRKERNLEVKKVSTISSKRKSYNIEELKVLQYLLENGGRAYQYEIAKSLGIPKSSLSRILKKLNENGIIKIDRRGRYNYIQVIDLNIVKKILSENQNVLE